MRLFSSAVLGWSLFATAGLSLLLGVAPASASCIGFSKAKQYERAEVIADGVVVREGPRYQFRVEHYEKGAGPRVLTMGQGASPLRRTSVDLVVEHGQRWRIYGWVNGEILNTNACMGSHRIGELLEDPSPQADPSVSTQPDPASQQPRPTSESEPSGLIGLGIILTLVFLLAAAVVAFKKRG